MYIQITTRCNMTCEHCCMNCTSIGDDMPMEVLEKALEMSDGSITIGGGEPTIHKNFWEMFETIFASNPEYIWMATNGSMATRVLALASMSIGSGKFGIALSQDNYHDPIEDEVIDFFKKNKLEIRNVSGHEINGGRCDFGSDDCSCSDMMVKPNGDIYACGCDDSPLVGNVFDGIKEEYQDCVFGECHRSEYFKGE